MKIATVVGARPQFVKAGTVSRLLWLAPDVEDIWIHTGQHYDANLSQLFFDELEIPRPHYHLGIGGLSHGAQTGRMIEKIEAGLLEIRPDWVLVYGDTDSTLAGALAASKLQLRVAHVEAGLRCGDRMMPEETNRVLTDHVSDLLFCPTTRAIGNLAAEGITRGVHNVGDVMYDALLYNRRRAHDREDALERYGLSPRGYLLATVHRAANTDSETRLRAILEAFGRIECQILFPLHPRTRLAIDRYRISVPVNVQVVEPVGYLAMLRLEENARCILTDSGGVQKEAYFMGVPCVTLREHTEWGETVEAGWNRLVGANADDIVAATRDWDISMERPPLFGDGNAASRIVSLLREKASCAR